MYYLESPQPKCIFWTFTGNEKAVSTIFGDYETGEISQVHVTILKNTPVAKKIAIFQSEIGHTFGLGYSNDDDNITKGYEPIASSIYGNK